MTSNPLFLDTSGLFSLFDEGDARHQKALDLLHHRLEKTYSLCAAVSFVLMRERGVNESLTTDKHFAQEGFIRLLPS